MILRKVYVRFYKSFNFDYLRKIRGTDQKPWEQIDGQWYPFVEIPIEQSITTVVGANESGKSQLLSAIKKGLTGKGLDDEDLSREDFCRYSKFNEIGLGKMRWPDIGFEFCDLTVPDVSVLKKVTGFAGAEAFDTASVFRYGPDEVYVYINNSRFDIVKEKQIELIKSLPQVFIIDPEIALPDSVPISFLVGEEPDALTRDKLYAIAEFVEKNATMLSDSTSIQNNRDQISAAFSNVMRGASDLDKEKIAKQRSEHELARQLLCKIAKIDPKAFVELYRDLKEGEEGQVQGYVDKINDHLARSLNFPQWWVQDKQFQLRVSCRDRELVFTIRDRTQTEYTFSERSNGLKYFLSYYVQYLAHDRLHDGHELLLMDEPDAFLSSQAQQDLLKIFEGFAFPEDRKVDHIQVLYVTHSPFLIDKNHAERIRVLDKGFGDEGTQVVNSIHCNQYEPLRSAFGAFVGETTFIGSANLIVEGMSDQILLAAAAAATRRLDNNSTIPSQDKLDLNTINIVPASGASSVPFIVYIATGRDEDKPAVVTLLDSDKAGKDAVNDLKKGVRGIRKLKPEYIIEIGTIVGVSFSTVEPTMEDLIPEALAFRALVAYLDRFVGLKDEDIKKISLKKLSEIRSKGKGMWIAIEELITGIGIATLHVEKIGYARMVADLVYSSDESTQDFAHNFQFLFRIINEGIRKSRFEQKDQKIISKIDGLKKSFVTDHKITASKEEASFFFEEIREILEPGTTASDEVIAAMNRIILDYDLKSDIAAEIRDYPAFKERLEEIKYISRLKPLVDAVHANVTTPPILTTPIETATSGSGIKTGDEPKVQPRTSTTATL